MRRLLAPITAVLLLTGAWSSPASAASDVEVRFTADKQEITLGEPARLSLEVVHPAGYQVIFPSYPESGENSRSAASLKPRHTQAAKARRPPAK